MSFFESVGAWVGGGVGGVVEGEPSFVAPLSVVVEFGEPSVVLKFPGVAYFWSSVVISVLPSGWLLVVVFGSVWFVGGVGEVVDVVWSTAFPFFSEALACMCS